MISNGKSFYSISGINNNFSYNLLNNLAIQGNVGLFMVKSPFQKNNLMMNQMLMTYDALLHINPSKMLFCNSISKMPQGKETILHFIKGLINNWVINHYAEKKIRILIKTYH